MGFEGGLGKRDIVRFGPFQLDFVARQLCRSETPLGLGGRALGLLIFLVENAGGIVSKREILAAVWPDVIIEEVTLRSHVAALRKALDDGDSQTRYIDTVSGRGYSFVAPVHRSSAPQLDTKSASTPTGDVSSALARAPQIALIGRDEVIETVCESLLEMRFLNIVGPGGIGKTSVAFAAIAAMQSNFEPNSIHILDLSALSEGADLPGTVLSLVQGTLTEKDAERALIDHYRGKRALLVLDNCEHIVEAAARLAETLHVSVPSLFILTTSRELLRAQGEAVHHLAGLYVPDDALSGVDDILAASSVRLSTANKAAIR